MEITPPGPGPAPAGAARGPDRAPAAPASDFQTFLTLLTAQMRNQDPLKPIESTEFVAQLASFSAVEQQIRSNEQLENILQALAGGSSAGLAQWIGREVRAPAAASFQGVPVEVEVDPDPQAEAAMLVVRNAFDQVVARRPVEADATLVVWDGRNALGELQPHGAYSFELEIQRGGEPAETRTGRVFAAVQEVRLENGEAQLVLHDGTTISVDTVTAIR